MQHNKDDIQINSSISYSIAAMKFSSPLKIINHSDHLYIFKIKTNQKTVISMQSTHDFIKGHTTAQIMIKMIDKPTENTALKLEVNYAVATPEEIQNHDSKLTKRNKQEIHKQILTIKRVETVTEASPQQHSKFQKSDHSGNTLSEYSQKIQEKSSNFELSTPSKQKQILFQTQKKQESSQRPIQNNDNEQKLPIIQIIEKNEPKQRKQTKVSTEEKIFWKKLNDQLRQIQNKIEKEKFLIKEKRDSLLTAQKKSKDSQEVLPFLAVLGLMTVLFVLGSLITPS